MRDVALRIFTKNMHAGRIFYKELQYRILYENRTNDLVAGSRLQTEELAWSSHKAFFFNLIENA